MKPNLRFILGALLLVCLLTPSPPLTDGAFADSPLDINFDTPLDAGFEKILDADFDTTLEPGVWHGWVMGPSSWCGGYIVEVTPLEPSDNGAYVEEALVRPEFNRDGWNDVLRIRIPADQPPLKVNVHVYHICRLPVVADFEATLTPGDWMGWVVGPAEIDRGYVVEVTPLEPSVDGAYVAKALVQEEFFMEKWQDVLRAQIPEGMPDLKVHLRVYSTEREPIIGKYEIDLKPGEWTGIQLQPSMDKGWYIIEINPRQDPIGGEFVERRAVRPEFDGISWYDVLRLQSPAEQQPLSVQVLVYGWGE